MILPCKILLVLLDWLEPPAWTIAYKPLETDTKDSTIFARRWQWRPGGGLATRPDCGSKSRDL